MTELDSETGIKVLAILAMFLGILLLSSLFDSCKNPDTRSHEPTCEELCAPYRVDTRTLECFCDLSRVRPEAKEQKR